MLLTRTKLMQKLSTDGSDSLILVFTCMAQPDFFFQALKCIFKHCTKFVVKVYFMFCLIHQYLQERFPSEALGI